MLLIVLTSSPLELLAPRNLKREPWVKKSTPVSCLHQNGSFPCIQFPTNRSTDPAVHFPRNNCHHENIAPVEKSGLSACHGLFLPPLPSFSLLSLLRKNNPRILRIQIQSRRNIRSQNHVPNTLNIIYDNQSGQCLFAMFGQVEM